MVPFQWDMLIFGKDREGIYVNQLRNIESKSRYRDNSYCDYMAIGELHQPWVGKINAI